MEHTLLELATGWLVNTYTREQVHEYSSLLDTKRAGNSLTELSEILVHVDKPAMSEAQLWEFSKLVDRKTLEASEQYYKRIVELMA